MIINLEFLAEDGQRVGLAHDVHPSSQKEPIRVPAGAVSVTVWLGIT